MPGDNCSGKGGRGGTPLRGRICHEGARRRKVGGMKGSESGRDVCRVRDAHERSVIAP